MGYISSQYPGKCRACKRPHKPGDRVYWTRGTRGVLCVDCARNGERERSTERPSTRTENPRDSRPMKTTGGIPGVLRVENTGRGRESTFTVEWQDLKTEIREAGFGRKRPGLKVQGNQSAWSSNVFKSDGNSSWRGYSNSDAERWLIHGYQLGGMEFENPPIPVRERRYFLPDEDAEEFIAEDFFSGEDEFFAGWTMQESIPGLAVEAEICFMAATDQSVLKEYFSFLCRAIYALEKSGIDLDVTLKSTVNSLYAGSPAAYDSTIIRVKHENEITDFSSWSPMLSPASLRTFAFAGMIAHADAAGKVIAGGFGHTIGTNTWSVKFNHSRGVLEIDVDSRARSFPAERMESQLREALQEMKRAE
jgi:hypothetical protein